MLRGIYKGHSPCSFESGSIPGGGTTRPRNRMLRGIYKGHSPCSFESGSIPGGGTSDAKIYGVASGCFIGCDDTNASCCMHPSKIRIVAGYGARSHS